MTRASNDTHRSRGSIPHSQHSASTLCILCPSATAQRRHALHEGHAPNNTADQKHDNAVRASWDAHLTVTRRAYSASGIVLDVRAQFRDRAKAHGPVGKLGLDGTVGIERVGHAVDYAGLEDRDRARLPFRWRARLCVWRRRWRRLPRHFVRPRLVDRSTPLGPHRIERFGMRWPRRLRPEQEIKPRLRCSTWPRLRLGFWQRLALRAGVMAIGGERNLFSIGDDSIRAHRGRPQPLQRRARHLDSRRRCRLGRTGLRQTGLRQTGIRWTRIGRTGCLNRFWPPLAVRWLPGIS
jgi:hypothetical protein